MSDAPAARRRLPRRRRADTFSFTVGDAEGYLQVGLHDDGSPGEIFLSVSKSGTLMRAFPDALAIAVSLALQHGVPLETICRKYVGWSFEPCGMTVDPEIPEASSVLDYVFRRLALSYLDEAAQVRVGARDPAAAATA